MNFERVVKIVHSRSEMHKAIDALPDDGEALLLYNYKKPDLQHCGFVKFNVPTWADVVYFLGWFTHQIYAETFSDAQDD